MWGRIAYSVLSAAQLEILQEVITLSVCVPCAIFHLKEPPKLEYLWASLCILGAVLFHLPQSLELHLTPPARP
jgi:uncharacterized protein (DUF486 family)